MLKILRTEEEIKITYSFFFLVRMLHKPRNKKKKRGLYKRGGTVEDTDLRS